MENYLFIELTLDGNKSYVEIAARSEFAAERIFENSYMYDEILNIETTEW